MSNKGTMKNNNKGIKNKFNSKELNRDPLHKNKSQWGKKFRSKSLNRNNRDPKLVIKRPFSSRTIQNIQNTKQDLEATSLKDKTLDI